MLHTLFIKKLFLFIILIFLTNLQSLYANLNEKKNIVFAYSDSIHFWGDHENKIFAQTLANLINLEFKDSIQASAKYLKEDSDFESLKSANAVVIISEGEKFHPFFNREELLKKLNENGISFGFLHYSLQPENKDGYDVLDKIINAHYEPYYSVNPTFDAKFEKFASHPVSNGVKPFSISDEWYFNIKFTDSPRLTHIAKVIPPDKVRKYKMGAHSGNEVVRKNIGKEETILWVCENENGTRGFGFTGGHSIFNLLNDNLRKLLLNSCVWLTKIDVPKDGVNSKSPDFSELESQITKQPRRDILEYKKRWQ